MAFYRCGGGKPEQEKRIEPSLQVQVVLPDAGKTLKKVTVESASPLIDAKLNEIENGSY